MELRLSVILCVGTGLGYIHRKSTLIEKTIGMLHDDVG